MIDESGGAARHKPHVRRCRSQIVRNVEFESCNVPWNIERNIFRLSDAQGSLLEER